MVRSDNSIVQPRRYNLEDVSSWTDLCLGENLLNDANEQHAEREGWISKKTKNKAMI